MTPTDYKAAVVAAARRLLARGGGGFRRAEVAEVLGGDTPRLGRALKALRRFGVLASGGRGLFVAGPGLDDAARLGRGVETAEAVERFMAAQGGMATVAEIRREMGVTDDAGRKALQRALERGGYLAHGEGLWLARDWRSAILPGWRIGLAVRLERGRYSVGEDNAMRARISAGIGAAREAAGLGVEGLAGGKAGDFMVRDLGRSLAMVLTGDRPQTLGTCWRARVDRLGDADARVLTWVDLEEGRRRGEGWAGDALSAEFWLAFARAVGCDPAAVSRGLAR